jgi:CheY-like chemotaxis protein
LERARIEVPDVYLLDIGLPVIDGNEVARRLRANPATAGALLIAVTGYGQIHDREGSLAAGFDHHFVKPIDIERLSELLHGLQASGSSDPP